MFTKYFSCTIFKLSHTEHYKQALDTNMNVIYFPSMLKAMEKKITYTTPISDMVTWYQVITSVTDSFDIPFLIKLQGMTMQEMLDLHLNSFQFHFHSQEEEEEKKKQISKL